MEHQSNKTTSTDDIILFVDVAYGVSLLSLLTTLIIYRLNMKQLGSVSNQIEHPLKKARALMVLQCSLYLLLSQVSQLAWVHVTELRPVKTNFTYWLQLLYTLFVVCFYTWCSVLYILNYYLTKYLKNASREISLVYVYILSYSDCIWCHLGPISNKHKYIIHTRSSLEMDSIRYTAFCFLYYDWYKYIRHFPST